MTGCRDAEAPYCQCAACAGDCCCRAEHLHLPCPVADCPDYVPRGRDDFVPVLTSRPAVNSSESPGKNGITTTPVSTKMMRNSSAYTQAP